MLERPSAATHCLWCLLVLSAGPTWHRVNSDSVPAPPKIPSVIEEQAKFFQDFFSVQLSPYKIEFGHVCEDPNTWEQRYEKKDFLNHRDMGKVRWGDKKGGYGEHYWDLNHAGHAGNQDTDDYDDGSHQEDPQETYHDSGDQSNKYQSEQYNAEEAPHYEESDRNKRADTRENTQKYEDDIHYSKRNEEIRKTGEDFKRNPSKKNIRDVPQNQAKGDDAEPNLEKSFVTNNQRKNVQDLHGKDTHIPRGKNNKILVFNHKEGERGNTFRPLNVVPYGGGAGVRQHLNSAVPAGSSVPSISLHPFTGHLLDRKKTRQPLILQPVHYYIHHS